MNNHTIIQKSITYGWIVFWVTISIILFFKQRHLDMIGIIIIGFLWSLVFLKMDKNSDKIK